MPHPRGKTVCYVLALSVVTGGRQPALPYRGEVATVPPSACWPGGEIECGGEGRGQRRLRGASSRPGLSAGEPGCGFPSPPPSPPPLQPLPPGSHFCACVNFALPCSLLPTGCLLISHSALLVAGMRVICRGLPTVPSRHCWSCSLAPRGFRRFGAWLLPCKLVQWRFSGVCGAC